MRIVIVIVSTAAILGTVKLATTSVCWAATNNARSDDGTDGVSWASRGRDEPEKHINHVNNPHGLWRISEATTLGMKITHSVQVKSVTEHELPQADGLLSFALERTSESKSESTREERRGRDPVDTDKWMLRTGNAPLRRVIDRDNWGCNSAWGVSRHEMAGNHGPR